MPCPTSGREESYLAVVGNDVSLGIDGDVCVEHSLAAFLLALVLLTTRLGQVVDADKDGHLELLGELLEPNLQVEKQWISYCSKEGSGEEGRAVYLWVEMGAERRKHSCASPVMKSAASGRKMTSAPSEAAPRTTSSLMRRL